MNFKIAASDFDGTLFREQNISTEDLAAIRAWRSAGNKFGLVTGRPLIMLAPILKEYALAVDFLICDNGAIIYCDGQIIFESELPKKILVDIINEKCTRRSLHFIFETPDEFICVNIKDTSWVWREETRWNFPLKIIDTAQVPSLQKVNQLALGFETPDEAKSAADALNQKFGDKIYAQRNYDSVDIVAASINKACGVENLLRLMNWRGSKIFVVGDESNDLPMIKRFGGYTVATAKDFVKREASAVFDSVGAMLQNFS